MESKFHTFAQPIQSIPLPERFTYPFHYTPHPLCVIAAEETQAYLKERTEWREELQTGKMFGVLVVRTPAGEVGYLAAFSGNLAGKNVHPFFVPPIYDLLQPDGFFRQEEERINEINARIRTLQASPALEDVRSRLQSTIEYCDFVLQAAKDLMKKRKEERDRLRQFPLTEEETTLLIKESQHMKAAHKLTKKSLRSILEEDQAKVDRLEQEIEQLKQERKRRSAALQRKLFEQFRILNARGEVKDLCELFAPTKVRRLPERVSAPPLNSCNTPTSISWNRSPWLSSGGAILPRRRSGTMDIIIRLAKENASRSSIICYRDCG
mgnify:CR=1 FL=1